MHMVAHDTKQIIVFSDKFLIVLKNQVMCLILIVDSQLILNSQLLILNKIAGLCK